jgi:hypothetical protein
MQLAGELAKMNLASLIRLVRNVELTGKISLTQGVNTGHIFFDTGQPIHVETDYGTGREALLELFLWQSGTFSYTECDVNDVPSSLSSDEPLEKLLKEGLAYQEALRSLEELGIGTQTILQATDAAADDLFLSRMDGKTRLADIVQSLGLARSEYVLRLKQLTAAGKTRIVTKPAPEESIELPDWVISRLKQDNPDVSQAIVQLVIWADRIKCWLYQADVDLERVINALDNPDSLASKPLESEPAPESFHPEKTETAGPIASNKGSYDSGSGSSSRIADSEKSKPASDSGARGAPRPPSYEF